MREEKHKHKCPDCGVEHDCPCGKICEVEYDKYPCEKCFGKYCTFMSDTIEGAGELRDGHYDITQLLI